MAECVRFCSVLAVWEAAIGILWASILSPRKNGDELANTNAFFLKKIQ